MKGLILVLTAVSLLIFSGCATIALDGRSAEHKIEMTATGERPYEVVKSFSVNDKAGWIIGIIPVNLPAGDNNTYLGTLIDQQVSEAGGDGAINVKIRAQNQFVDLLINVVTFGIYYPRTVTISGDIIKYRQ
jgi:hypothetical protein